MVTTTGPVVAPTGTATPMLLAFQLEGVATAPLKVTVLAPCELPRFDPLIATVVPTGPDIGEIPEMVGTTTEKLTPLLRAPPTVTTTGPVVAAAGTLTMILVVFQLV